MKVTLVEGIFERDVATFMDMDPHYLINWKEDRIVGESAHGGGKCPRWNKSHEFNIGTDKTSMGVMTLSFLDDSKLICSTEL